MAKTRYRITLILFDASILTIVLRLIPILQRLIIYQCGMKRAAVSVRKWLSIRRRRRNVQRLHPTAA